MTARLITAEQFVAAKRAHDEMREAKERLQAIAREFNKLPAERKSDV